MIRTFPKGKRAKVDTAQELLITQSKTGRLHASLDFGCAGTVHFPAPSFPLILSLLAFACPHTVTIETPEAQACFGGLFNITNFQAMHAFFEGGRL